MKKHILLLASLLFMLSNGMIAQNVEVLDFPAFEKRLKRTGDTLYIYNFWATWCRPCVKELPYFTRLDSVYRDRKVKVEFVSLDLVEQMETAVKPMVSRKLAGQKVLLLDAPKYNEWIDKVSPEWSGAIPTSLGVHNGQEIYDLRQQSFEYEELTAWVEEMLTSITSK